jgi:hypothetical protein
VILQKRDWPAATLAFLEGRRDVAEASIAYEALRWPVYHPLNSDIMDWIKRAMTGLGWKRQGKSTVWRMPARA